MHIAQAIASGILDTLEMDHVIDPPGIRVQVGAFRNPTYANRLLNELLEQDFPAQLSIRTDSSGCRSETLILGRCNRHGAALKEQGIQLLLSAVIAVPFVSVYLTHLLHEHKWLPQRVG